MPKRLWLSKRKIHPSKSQVKWYNLSIEETFEKLESPRRGLSIDEVKKRQKKYGQNSLPEEKYKSWLKIFFNQFKSSLVYILLIAAIISFFLGDNIDAGVILLAVFINVLIGFYQEKKAQKTLRALKKIVVSYAKVLRDGHLHQIGTQDLVPGDIVFLQPGDKVPADLRLFKVSNLKINEAALTGEVVEVSKTHKVLTGDLILPDQENIAFMATVVTQGTGEGMVVETGGNTAIGKIAQLVALTREERTPLQKKLDKFSKKLGYIILGACLFVFTVGLILYSPTKGPLKDYFTQMFTTSVAIAVSAIPEGLIVAVTVVLAIGMQRILKKHALVKRLLAAETLGSTTVICADKTGTLTEGEMRIIKIATCDWNFDILDHKKSFEQFEKGGEEVMFLLRVGMLCNNAYIENPKAELEHRVIRGTPTEKALLLAGAQVGFDKERLEVENRRLDEIPFDPSWKFMMTLNKFNRNYNMIYLKGAPEKVLAFVKFTYSLKSLGNEKIELKGSSREKIVKEYEKLSGEGLRVLALAYKKVPVSEEGFSEVSELYSDFVLLGVVGMKDPLRSAVKETVKLTQKAGIHPVMITGDHKLTALAVAKELGLPSHEENILIGEELNKIKESKLLEMVKNISIYARVLPEDKLKIVKAWQDKGEVVAMTGDGINDSPALKKADIGLALGSGTDVAKEAADMILLDNNFNTIVEAVREGRVIYDNIKKVILYFLSNSFAEMLIILTGLIFGWPLPLLASQIIWVNLINDTFPALALTREPALEEVMLKKPEKGKQPILDFERKLLIGVISLVCALGALSLFYFFWQKTQNINLARTIAFTTLALSSLFYIFSVRNLERPIWQTDLFSNKFLLGSILIGIFLQSLALYHPFFQKIFSTVPLGIVEWLIIVLISLGIIGLIEIIKWGFIKYKHS